MTFSESLWVKKEDIILKIIIYSQTEDFPNPEYTVVLNDIYLLSLI